MANENQDTVENKGTNINWARAAVRTAHGAVDTEATLALCAEELALHVAENEVDMTEIAGAVDKVFAKLAQGTAQKVSIDLNGLATRAFGLLGETPDGSETMLTNRIKDYVRGESERFVASNGDEGKCVVIRGKLGGVRAATPKTIAEYKAFQAKKLAATAK